MAPQKDCRGWYGKLDIPAQYQDPKNPIPPRIAAKFVMAIQSRMGLRLSQAQEYSTGIPWVER